MRFRAHPRAPAALVVSLACFGTCSSVQAAAQTVRTVVTIHQGTEDYPANPLLDAGIREGLASIPGPPLDYFAEYLEVDRFPPELAAAAMADSIRLKYQGRHIDLVIAMTGASLNFVLDHRGDLFPDVPIVFMDVAPPADRVRYTGAGMAGVITGNAYGATLNVALNLHPATEQVFVIAHSPNKQVVESVRAELRDFSRRVVMTFLDEPTLPPLLERVKGIGGRSLILYIWQAHNEPGNVIYPDRIGRMVVDAAAVPVYGTSDFYVGTGVVGGVIRWNRDTGVQVGTIARRILNGTPAQDIPIESSRLVPVFDWRQLRRWGIDPAILPAGSDVRFHVPTAWESYRGYIAATAIVLVAQLALIAVLLTQRTRLRRADETIRAREATLRKSYERIRQLAGQLIHAQEATRANVARDLHDGVCQDLAGLSIAINSLKNSPGRIEEVESQQAFSAIQHETRHIFESTRRLSHDLHPATLGLLGLVSALKSHCAEVQRRNNVDVSFKTDGGIGRLEKDSELCLFRIAQEALRNGVEHSGSKRFAVSLAGTPSHVELTVTDDGCGFDLGAVRQDGRGLGLVSMEERARLFGGDVQIVTAPGRGTTIRATVINTPAADREDWREGA
jgi:signal transduction histidine kinase